MASVYSVGQINSYIKNMFAQDFLLNRVSVKGEVSNCKYHTTGHIYFSLKDEAGAIACVMFSGSRSGLNFRLEDGQQIVVSGSISVYERSGSYQLYAKTITREGIGALYERYERLKQELAEMGMFAPEYKQPIPRHVKRLGVVTAPTGAAVRDIINIATRRNPGIQIILYPALVQGQGAAQSVVRGIQTLDRAGVDVMIVGRGGGSIEDLWAFNEEIVAQAIFQCSTPVISAVGHETDVVISDYVADLRAPTPSAAAELAVEDVRQTIDTVNLYKDTFYRRMEQVLDRCREKNEKYEMRLKLASPLTRLNDRNHRLMLIEERMQSAMRRKIEEARRRVPDPEQLDSIMASRITQSRHALELRAERLNGLSPQRMLDQGYAFVTDENGKRIAAAAAAHAGDDIQIYFADGRIGAVVKETAHE